MVLMGENPILKNKMGGGNELGGWAGTWAEPTAGQQKGVGGGGEYRKVSADGGRVNAWASSDYTGVLKKLLK